jgi:hypothetical protein
MWEERGPASWNGYLIIEYRAILKESILFRIYGVEAPILEHSVYFKDVPYFLNALWETVRFYQASSHTLWWVTGWQKIMAGKGGQHCRCSTYRDLQPLFPLSILVDTSRYTNQPHSLFTTTTINLLKPMDGSHFRIVS